MIFTYRGFEISIGSDPVTGELWIEAQADPYLVLRADSLPLLCVAVDAAIAEAEVQLTFN